MKAMYTKKRERRYATAVLFSKGKFRSAGKNVLCGEPRKDLELGLKLRSSSTTVYYQSCCPTKSAYIVMNKG